MAGNSSRRGAVRKPGSKKGSVVGSGGQRRKGLQGKGPTPKASERTGHPAARKAASAARAGGTGGTSAGTNSSPSETDWYGSQPRASWSATTRCLSGTTAS